MSRVSWVSVDHLGLQMKPEALRTHSDSHLEAEIHKYVQANSEKCYYLCFKWILFCTLAFSCILVYLWDAPCTGNRSSPCSSFFSPRILNSSRLFKSVLAFSACCSAESCDGWGCCALPSSPGQCHCLIQKTLCGVFFLLAITVLEPGMDKGYGVKNVL